MISAVLLRGKDRQGWWKAGHRDRLLTRLEAQAFECTVVFDGADPRRRELGPVTVRYVPDADAWLVAQAAVGDTVVTRDRRLVNRLRTRDVTCRSPTWLEAEVGGFTAG